MGRADVCSQFPLLPVYREGEREFSAALLHFVQCNTYLCSAVCVPNAYRCPVWAFLLKPVEDKMLYSLFNLGVFGWLVRRHWRETGEAR